MKILALKIFRRLIGLNKIFGNIIPKPHRTKKNAYSEAVPKKINQTHAIDTNIMRGWQKINALMEKQDYSSAVEEGRQVLRCAPSPKDKDTLAKLMAVCAYRSEVDNNLEAASNAYYVAYIASNDESTIRSKYYQIELFKLLRAKKFAEANTFYENRPPRLVAVTGSGEFEAPFVDVAIEYELKGDFLNAIICYELALKFECKDSIVINSKNLQLKLFLLLRKQKFTEVDVLLSELPKSFIASSGCRNLEIPFVTVASEYEIEGDLENSINCYKLALNCQIGDFNIIKNRIVNLQQSHLRKLIDRFAYSEAVEFNNSIDKELKKLDLKELQVCSVKDYCSIHAQPYFELKSSRNITEPIIHFFGEAVQLDSECGDLVAPPQYSASIENCTIFPRGNLIVKDNFLISDLASNPNSKEIIYGDVNVESGNSAIFGIKNSIAIVDTTSVSDHKIDKGLMLFGVQSKNYGHWVCEFLPRMLAFDTLFFEKNIPIYIDDNMPDSHLESIEILNSIGRPIIKLPKHLVNFSELGIASVPAFFPLETKAERKVYDTVWPSDIFNELKEKIISSIKSKYHKNDDIDKQQRRLRLVISRKNFNLRQLVNEKEITDFLILYGFEIIYPEELTFSEQVLLFSKAEIVVGSCSSALTNCLFCPPDCKIIGLIHELSSFNFRGYASFIQSGGASISFLRGTTINVEGLNNFHNNFIIEIDKLVSNLENILPDIFLPQQSGVELQVDFWEDRNHIFDRAYVFRTQPHLGRGFGAWMYQNFPDISVNPNLLFDDKFYKAQVGYKIENMTALDHYLIHGADLGLDPSPLFSTTHYLTTYADVAAAKMNPLVHFLKHGMAGGRLPVPMNHPQLRENALHTLAQDSKNFYARAWIVSFALRDGNLDHALDHLHRVTGTAEIDYVVRVAFFTVLLELDRVGRRCEALVAYEKLLEFSPRSTFLRYQLATLLRSWGDINGAHRQLQLGKEFALDELPVYYVNSLECLENEQSVGLRLDLDAEKFTQVGAIGESALIREKIQAVRPDLIDSDARNILKLNSDNIPSRCNISAGISQKRLLILDTIFPSKLSSFRYGEFLAYLENIPEAEVVSSIWDTPQLHGSSTYFDLLDKFGQEHPSLRKRVSAMHKNSNLSANLVYTVFLNNAALLWQEHPSMVRSEAIFTLYPGGGFDLNDPISDIKLRRLCDDRRVRKIITTQHISRSYLIDNQFCEADRILPIFGGIVPSAYKPKTIRREIHTKVINVCFVAQRYSESGIEKGSDIFSSVARILSRNSIFNFHFVGDWSPSILGEKFLNNCFFHGVQPASFFANFYGKMDVIISPNISNYEITKASGSFDGFPTTACVEAGLAGVAMFLSDSLGLNKDDLGNPIFLPGVEFELIERNVEQICERLEYYSLNRDALLKLSQLGQAALRREFSFDRQMKPRIEFLQSELKACQ
ncbi:glycosyltransferase 61 family protein [Rhodoferax sp. WC2427]|uniref:glycosyltransferase 61 family protein n=1 Tax=Rhodoferax sp. WC2427 TaxID=3234144 RepID=UPI0034664008